MERSLVHNFYKNDQKSKCKDGTNGAVDQDYFLWRINIHLMHQ